MKKLLCLIIFCAVFLTACTEPQESVDGSDEDVTFTKPKTSTINKLSPDPDAISGETSDSDEVTLEIPGRGSPMPQGPSQDPDKPFGPPMLAQEATVYTSKGAIKIQLYPERSPNTVSNFIQKASESFYNGLTFHRVESWVVQGGDPDGNGTGGGQMSSELNNMPFKIGSVGMARGTDVRITNDSQFFICKSDCSFLTGQYANMGEVIEGMEVVQQLEIGDSIQSISYF